MRIQRIVPPGYTEFSQMEHPQSHGRVLRKGDIKNYIQEFFIYILEIHEMNTKVVFTSWKSTTLNNSN
jgi:hypothetical protein